MKSIGAYVFGFLAFFPLALVFAWMFLAALDAEADNLAAAQLKHDKKMMLLVPAVYKIKSRTFEECQIVKEELRCGYRNKNGEYGIVAVK